MPIYMIKQLSKLPLLLKTWNDKAKEYPEIVKIYSFDNIIVTLTLKNKCKINTA